MSTSDVPHYATPQMDEIFYFGKFKIDPSEVFLVTDHSYAFVNLKPVVPGHVLVSSRRVVNRFLDLTSEEVSDLWLTAKYVGQKLEPFYNASSLTFTIQDGPKAGQTVPHVHVHILPRKDGKFENNDEIQDVIDEKEKELAKKLNLDLERKDRTFEEMANEAANLRALF
jgi:bis(5'-adenosyl)-triphosphatase